MIKSRERGRFAGYVVIFSVGLFALVAQALLFRDFLRVYEGNELGVAAFFGSWLVWVAIGALVTRGRGAFLDRVADRFEFLPLLYLPAYVIQARVIGAARELAGVETYELFPLAQMLPVSFWGNAPVSFLTGALFTLGCQWMARHRGIPVARVYWTEALGGCVGGAGVTFLLARGAAAESVALCAGIVVLAAFGLHRFGRRDLVSGALALLLVAAALIFRIDARWAHARDLQAWARLLPAENLEGGFNTPQNRYLYGRYRDQFNVMAWETVVDSIPNTTYASEVIALHLAQIPEAKKILVVGSGSYAICRRFLDLAQVEEVTWLDPDPDYPARLLRAVPEAFRTDDPRLRVPGRDVRSYLESGRGPYDLVILNLPNVTTLALNRYFTREFFALLKESLADPGVVGARVTAGENVMGDELVNVGASLFRTLSDTFEHLVIKPGDETWLLVSDQEVLRDKPGVLRHRLANIDGIDALYPPDGVMSLYLPDRAQFQLASYFKAVEADEAGLLLNTDRHPKALFHNLLYVARQAGGGTALSEFIRSFARAGTPLLLWAVALYVALRAVYLLTGGRMPSSGSPAGGSSRFDWYFLVFSTGLVSMSTTMLLMFMFQSHYGSLFLFVGLLSALFMLGLFIGSTACEQLLLRREGAGWLVLWGGLLLYAGLLVLLMRAPTDLPRSAFASLFVLTGVLSGVYVPIAAHRLLRQGVTERAAGGTIDLSDHLGGALGGLLTGLFLLPVLGSTQTLAVLMLLLAANVPALSPRVRSAAAGRLGSGFEVVVRRLGYSLFGFCAFLLVASNLLARVTATDFDKPLAAFAGSLAPGTTPSRETRDLGNGTTLSYYVLPKTGESAETYVFSTELLAPDQLGYGGPITLALALDRDGVLRGLRVLQSDETPDYLDFLAEWQEGLAGHNLISRALGEQVDGVTGATLSSEAMIAIADQAGRRFAEEVLGLQPGEPAPPELGLPVDYRALVLVLFTCGALVLRARPSRAARRLFLVLVVACLGFWLNAQYSLVQVLSLAGAKFPAVGFSVGFLLLVGVPVVVLLLGNLYCGYLCPFGALQELVGDLRPRKLTADPNKNVWRYGRMVKYVLLAALLVLFAFTRDTSVASTDPLVLVFNAQQRTRVLALGSVILCLSFFFGRFWCRNLCPAGAFLALLHGIKGLRRLVPRIHPARCGYGVVHRSDLDCICCDRCRGRVPEPADARPARQQPSWVHLAYACAVCLVAFVFLRQLATERRAREDAAVAVSGAAAAIGVIREPDMQRLLRKIEQHELSDHEAMYYRPLDDAE